MSIEIVGKVNGVLTVTISGRLKQSEHAHLQRTVMEKIGPQEKVGILVVATNFEGWDKGADWGDLDLQFAMDPLIRKMAIVGDRKWENLTLMFTAKGVRSFPIEFFSPSEIAKATAWVEKP